MECKKYLEKATVPLKLKERSISELVSSMRFFGFQGRKLGESLHLWDEMLESKKTIIFLGLAGAVVPAGLRCIISELIKKRFVDCLVSTGANIFHDIHECLGRKHYIGTHNIDDRELLKFRVDRIHDIFASENEFRESDKEIEKFIENMERRIYSSREFLDLLGNWLVNEAKEKEGILLSALSSNVPIFVPALCDSSIGISIMLARKKDYELLIDHMKDVDEIMKIVEKAENTGVIYVGGGVPKNFIQQTEVMLDFFKGKVVGHKYAIQYTTDNPFFGGLSGCTFDEAISWGKIAPDAKKIQVFTDATIALPIIAHALLEIRKGKKRDVPNFEWKNDELRLEWKRC
ncbi:MAG: deoxyhypusine synthase [Candidatus Thermoplasmatota archaeon]